MAKKISFVVILIIFLTAVYAHGNAKDVPLKDIDGLLSEKTDITSMEKEDDRGLMQFMHMDPARFEEYLYYRNSEALSVEELLIVKVEDREELSSLKDDVDKRIREQTKTFESYGPVQIDMLKNAIVSTNGNYLFYCTGPNGEKYREVFYDAI